MLLAAEVTTGDPSGVLLQYGALGVLTLLAIMAVRVMYNREVQAADRERQRADRLEEELRKLNDMIRSDYVGTISQATRAIVDANDAVSRALLTMRNER